MISPPPSFIDIKNGFKSSFDFIRKKCLLENRDIHRFVFLCDTMIRKCELTDQSLRLKLQMTK